MAYQKSVNRLGINYDIILLCGSALITPIPGRPFSFIAGPIIHLMDSFQKSKWVSFKKQAIHPIKRWGHTSTIIGEHLYIFGGKLDQQTKKSSDSFYRLNCNSFEFRKLELASNPEMRDSHTAFAVNHKLYIWGGVVKQKATNDCYVFDDNSWMKVDQKGSVPQPRESHVSAVSGNFLLVYGGCNQDTVYEDFNLFDTATHTWYPVTVLGKIPKRQSPSLTLLDNSFYMFGGQTETQQKQKQQFFNDLFRITLHVNLPSVQIRIQPIESRNQCPTSRSCHCAVGYSNRYLIIIGGLSSKDESLNILSDVWSFDLVDLMWREIKGANSSLFKKHANFTAELFNQSIFIFGGLKSTGSWSSYDDLLELQLFDLDDYVLQTTCSMCKMPSSKFLIKEERLEINSSSPKAQNINLRTLYKMAQLIPHPYQAIALLLKSSLMIKATEILVKFQQINNRKVLSIFDNGLILDKQEFQDVVFDCSIPKQNKSSDPSGEYVHSIKEYANAVKYGCFKLSESFLIVHTNQTGNMAAVVTPENSYYYDIYFNKRYYEVDENYYQKIRDYMTVSGIFKQIGEGHHSNCNSKKILFNLTCDGKRSNYELVNGNNDILLKRLVDLQGPDQSLKEYISDFFLSPIEAKIYVNQSEVKINAKQILHQKTFRNGEVVAITNTSSQTFNVYSKGCMVARLSSHKYKRGGIVVVPDSWDIDHLGLGPSQQMIYLQELVDFALAQWK